MKLTSRLNLQVICAAPLLLLAAACPAFAEISPANIFNNHMVLPRETPFPVWGTATPGETVSISFAGQNKSTTANANGKWTVTFDPLPASAEPRELHIKGSNSNTPVVLTDILVGEVWLASGQSNMATSAGPDAANDDTPLIRLAGVESAFGSTIADDIHNRSRWRVASSANAGGASGTALYFARGLQAELDIPIGVIVSAVGGTRIEAWMRAEALDQAVPDSRYKSNMVEQVEKGRLSPPPNPDNKPDLHIAGTEDWMHARIGGRFNGMIAPLAPFPVRGVIWYQGEDNARDNQIYAKMLPAMISDWRATWKRELPFLIVQLPSYNADRKPDGTAWAEMRAVQEQTANTVPNCAIAITFDNDDPDELHPRNKPTVGDRLARVALNKIYQKQIVASGPQFNEMRVNGNQAFLKFIDHGDGLISKNNAALDGFEIAGKDRVFSPASAEINGDIVIVSSPDVRIPVAVRYAWKNAPTVSLFNKSGLPAAPFRTDDW